MNLFSKWYCNGNTLPHNWNLWTSYHSPMSSSLFSVIFIMIIQGFIQDFRIGCPKYTLRVNWVSNSFLSHCIIHQKYIWQCPKSAIGCPKDTRTPLWLKACCYIFKCILCFLWHQILFFIPFARLVTVWVGSCLQPTPCSTPRGSSTWCASTPGATPPRIRTMKGCSYPSGPAS